jgi:hypothetical protein
MRVVVVGPYAAFEEQKIAQKEAEEAELVTLRAADQAIHALFAEARARRVSRIPFSRIRAGSSPRPWLRYNRR